MNDKVECCLQCSFLAWSRQAEHFFCARTLEKTPVKPMSSVCPGGVRKVYRRRQPRPVAHQFKWR